MPMSIISKPLSATAVDGDVVLTIKDRGIKVAAALTPEAVLASLAPMQEAAERAIADSVEDGAPAPTDMPASFAPLVRRT